jgi:hypothetical protein
VYVPRAAFSPSPGLRYDALRYDGPVESPMNTRITRVEIGYKDAAATVAYTAATAAVQIDPVDVEAIVGRRVMSLDTILSNAANAAATAAAWASIAGQEARTPQIGPLTYETGRSGGFPDYYAAAWMLSGWPGGQRTFVRGTWPTAIGVRPMFGIGAATLTYADGQWSVSFTPAPVSAAGTLTPITANTAAASTAVRLRDLDPAVTVGDLAFIEAGAGITPA